MSSHALPVELTIRRKGGSTAHMPPTDQHPNGKTYHFKPSDTDERHIALVGDTAHLQRFLSIEGYKLLSMAPVAVHDAEGKGGDVTGGNVATATPAPEEPAPAPVVLPEPAPEPTEPEPAPPSDLTGMTDDELKALFEVELGRKPKATISRKVLIASIEAARAERA